MIDISRIIGTVYLPQIMRDGMLPVVEATPNGRIWSLLDVLRFYATSFTTAVANLQAAEATIVMHAHRSNRDEPMNVKDVRQIRTWIEDLAKECEDLPLSNSYRYQLQRLQDRMSDDSLFKHDHGTSACMMLIQEAKHNLVNELSGHYFLMIRQERRGLYEQNSPLFGQDVAIQFGSANRDIADAGRCLALDQWTAAIFHLMRAVEHGLKELADQLGVAMDREGWKGIIDRINAKIKQMEQLPRDQKDPNKIAYYSRAASQMFFFKDAWRNHVSHAGAAYDEREALTVFTAVREFMQQLAGRVP